MFFALKGENFNGNRFAEAALSQGALYAIVDEVAYQTSDAIILVDNVLDTLQQLARYHRDYLEITIIALTGSNGKTTTKELINVVLSTQYITTATSGNLNNHIGVPLTILSMTPKTEIGIVEMGANHQKEIAFLAAIAQPDYGYITNFGKAHLEGFGGIEGVVKGKTELYQNIKQRNKIVFVNTDDAKQIKHAKGIKQITFGTNDSDYNMALIAANPFVKLMFESNEIESNLIGDYNYSNIAAAIVIGKHFKVPEQQIKVAIENYVPTNNRSQIIKSGTNKIILDAYNANPSSMKVALDNFSRQTDKNKIAILGDMFELGDDTAVEHQAIADLAGNSNIDVIYLIGKNFSEVSINYSKAKQFGDFDDFKKYFLSTEIDNASLLIKASRGMALERILEML